MTGKGRGTETNQRVLRARRRERMAGTEGGHMNGDEGVVKTDAELQDWVAGCGRRGRWEADGDTHSGCLAVREGDGREHILGKRIVK